MQKTIALRYSHCNSKLTIALHSNLLYTMTMENKEIRKANTLMLIDLLGSVRKLGGATDTAPNYISQIKRGERGMGDDLARRFEQKLGKPSGWMDALQSASEPSNASPESIPLETRSVPVVGTAQLGDNGYWDAIDYPVGYGDGLVRYPTKDKNAYALRVKGDSMRPRIKPGEFVLIEPNAAISPGDEVMVQTKDGRCMVKVLDFRRGGMVQLSSVNEDHKPITFEETEIKKMHRCGGIIPAGLYYRENL